MAIVIFKSRCMYTGEYQFQECYSTKNVFGAVSEYRIIEHLKDIMVSEYYAHHNITMIQNSYVQDIFRVSFPMLEGYETSEMFDYYSLYGPNPGYNDYRATHKEYLFIYKEVRDFSKTLKIPEIRYTRKKTDIDKRYEKWRKIYL